MAGTTVASPSQEIIGRELQLAIVRDALQQVPTGLVAVLIEGAPGIGKTTLWSNVVADARARSWRVLTSRPGEAETRLSYSGLADLLEPHLDEAIDVLPGPQRQAIEVALLRLEADRPVDARSVHAASLSTLRALAAAGPVLLAVDDVQWLDVPTLRVLQYVARRLTDHPVVIAVSHRTGARGEDPLELARAVTEDRLHRLMVGPMAAREIGRMIRARMDMTVPPAQLRRLHGATGGNPFFALEIARAVADRGVPLAAGENLPLPESLKDVLIERLARLPKNPRLALLAAAAMGRPSRELVEAAAGGGAGLERAIRAGVVEVIDGQVRFAHPLLAATAYQDAPEADRRLMHRRLAGLVGEQEERARHLALAAEGPDEEIAAELQHAAVQAHDRGAPDAGAELAELAMRLTPSDRPESRGYRAWLAARYHAPAGDLSRANELLTEALANLKPGPARAEAGLLLYTLPATGNARHQDRAILATAVQDARRDPQLAHDLEQLLAEEDYLAGRTHDPLACLRGARRGLARAERQDDPLTLASALHGLAFFCFLCGQGIRRDLMARGLALNRDHRFTLMYWGARDWARLQMFADELDEARETYQGMLQEAVDSGYESFATHFLARVAEVENLAGNFALAREYAARALGVIPETSGGGDYPLAASALALAEARLGNLEAAHGLITRSIESFRGSSRWVFQTMSEGTFGFIELSLGRYAEADAILWPAALRIERAGVKEPAFFRLVPDEIEALVGLGDLPRGKSLLEPFEQRARALDRVWARAEAARCRALLLAALGDLEGALFAIDEALLQHDRADWPFELGRTLLAQGEIRRRGKHKKAARESLTRALDIFRALGARVWEGRAQTELGRVGDRSASRWELTPSEEQVAQRVADGLTNREVAAALFISVDTVKANLKRVYAKLGVRSRTELARRLSLHGGPAAPPAGVEMHPIG